MEKDKRIKPTRREILRAFLAMPATFVLAACATQEISNGVTPPAAQLTSEPPPPVPPASTSAPTDTAAPAPPPTDTPAPTQVAQVLPPTPACGDDDDDPTPPQTEGPFYTPSTPERTSFLEPDILGTKLIVTGYVLSTDCQPVARALLDFWHCDDTGVYDNVGYRLRGHQFTDEQGQYFLETIMPGLYTGRTRHIHVKVQALNQPVLTTQLYFPNEPSNASDGIFQPELLMGVQDAADGKAATFNFVLNIA